MKELFWRSAALMVAWCLAWRRSARLTLFLRIDSSWLATVSGRTLRFNASLMLLLSSCWVFAISLMMGRWNCLMVG